MSDHYSLTVQNVCGAAQNVAVYQVYPNLSGFSLVWFAKNINDGNHNRFTWDINWQLNWGTTEQPLVEGVLWESGGTPMDVEPTSPDGINQITVGYNDGDFQTTSPIHSDIFPKGSMGIITDDSFTVKDALTMSVAVYMNGKATFSMQGRPNGTYLFDTHPVYYLCVTDHKVGVAVTGSFVTNPTEVVFNAGETELSYILTDTLEFKKG